MLHLNACLIEINDHEVRKKHFALGWLMPHLSLFFLCLYSVQKVPQTLDLGEGKSGQVSFTFRPASNASNMNVTGLAMITPRLTTETGMKLRGCPVMQRIYQQHVRDNK